MPPMLWFPSAAHAADFSTITVLRRMSSEQEKKKEREGSLSCLYLCQAHQVLPGLSPALDACIEGPVGATTMDAVRVMASVS